MTSKCPISASFSVSLPGTYRTKNPYAIGIDYEAWRGKQSRAASGSLFPASAAATQAALVVTQDRDLPARQQSFDAQITALPQEVIWGF
jgi:hypothetical protein